MKKMIFKSLKIAALASCAVVFSYSTLGLSHLNQEQKAILDAEADARASVAAYMTTFREAQVRILSEEMECLATNIYHEARGQSHLGQMATAMVVFNRMESVRYPNTVCGVVHQARLDGNGNPLRHKCQFSWYCDGRSDAITDTESWNTAVEIAFKSIEVWKVYDITEGSTMYHAEHVTPYWQSSYELTVEVDDHLFYK